MEAIKPLPYQKNGEDRSYRSKRHPIALFMLYRRHPQVSRGRKRPCRSSRCVCCVLTLLLRHQRPETAFHPSSFLLGRRPHKTTKRHFSYHSQAKYHFSNSPITSPHCFSIGSSKCRLVYYPPPSAVWPRSRDSSPRNKMQLDNSFEWPRRRAQCIN